MSYTAQQFIEAIPGTAGIISKIAKKVGCAWNTAKKYIDEHPTVLQAYVDECEAVLDMAESVVVGEIQNKDVHTAKWYLAMKGAQRGYAPTQKNEVTGKDGGAIEVSDGLTDEQRIARTMALLEAARARRDNEAD